MFKHANTNELQTIVNGSGAISSRVQVCRTAAVRQLFTSDTIQVLPNTDAASLRATAYILLYL